MEYIVALIADNHFVYTNEGDVYVNGTYTRQYLTRFTSNFDKVIVIARGRLQSKNDDLNKLRLSGGDNVEFCFIEDFQGIYGFIKKRRKIKHIINKQLKVIDSIFVRMPCILTTIALKCAKKNNIPIMIDVGADPETIYDGVSNRLFTWLLSKYLKMVCYKSCMNANGVSYVTKHILQNKYPCTAIKNGETIDYFTASISNVDISSDFYYKDRIYKKFDNRIKLIHISNYIPLKSCKGHTESLEILAYLMKNGINAELTFLGDGEGIAQLKNYAMKLNVSEFVSFAGRVADRYTYRNYLLNSDFFIFPSHSEGLPRVILEAMSTGLVCITSNVDGIPEIIDNENTFDFNDIKGMSKRIIYLIDNIAILNDISKTNLKLSLMYSHNNMKNTYDNYYKKVRNLIDYKENNTQQFLKHDKCCEINSN